MENIKTLLRPRNERKKERSIIQIKKKKCAKKAKFKRSRLSETDERGRN